MATDTETIIEALFTVLNTCGADLLTAKFKYNTPAAGGAINVACVASLVHIVLHSDHIFEIHGMGVRFLD